MKLKKLEIYGFKSFAQRTEIVFNQGITGIVGPNGSGKSNIGDAVRWVLGEQSAKTLRGAKMEDVIFNGTQKRKPLSYCEVSLVFDNEDRALPVDFAEVAVTRRVYRNGESEYYLNRSACRLRDIIDLFRDTGIGKEGYSIIGQGRIDDILSQRGEDRRQVFEEAAGIVKFKARKEDADKKLQRTLENMDRVEDIIKELERQLTPLEKQAETAREYLELSKELRVLDLNLFLLRHDQLKDRLAQLDETLATLAAILQQGEQALAEKTEARDKQQSKIEAIEARVTAARNELMNCADRVHTLKNEWTAAASRQENREENIRRMTGEQQSARERLEELTRMSGEQDGGLERQRQRLSEAQEALREATQAQDRLAREEAQKEQALEDYKAQMLEAMNRSSNLRNDQTRQTTMRAQMDSRLKELLSQDEQMAQRLEELQSAAQAAQGQLEQAKAGWDKLVQAHHARQQELAACDGELNILRQSAQEKTGQLQSAMSRLKLMEEMQREMEGFNQSVKRAMAFAHQRGMQGVRGVLAQLLTVPQRYETAIDMALGAAQQNIVTEDEDTAKTLIEYLRQNRLGRATFLPMTTVRSKLLNDRERQALRLPGCLGVASDLVQCDPAYRGIVENLLGRTVIATDLNAGIPIMRAGNHSFRLVTLQGDVMHSGGSMTGGSVQSKMTNLLGREREIKELSRSIEKDKAELNRLRETVNDRQQAKDSLKAQVAEAVEKAHQEEIAVARETQRLESARNELREHQGRMDAARQAEEQLREAIAQLDAQLQALQEESTADSYDPEAMQEETRRLQGVLTQAREASAAQRERVMQLTLALSDAQHELDSMERDKDRVSQETEQLRRDLTRREGQITGLKELVRQEQEHIAELDGQIATQEEAQKAQEAEVHAQEESRAQAQAGLRQLMEDIEALHRQNTEDGDKQHRTELTRSRVENELKTLQDRIWNTWEMTYAGAEAERITQGFDAAAAQSRAGELQSRIRAMGSVNVNAVEEYAATKARYDDLAAQREDLQKAEADLRELIGRLLTQMERTFVENFSKMQGYFAETFVRLFGGGHAELRLADPADPLNCGIEVIAQPPGKKLQLLSLLSGGERALTAIAILFAMLKLKPTPFCILDEIEAALDEANIGYFADYLVEYSKGTQFVVVTHRKGTMERCDSLYGVAMEEQGVSKMVSVSLQDYAS